jgi:hypothetical protein
MVLDIQTVHHILKNTAVQNVNEPFVYITDLTSTLRSLIPLEMHVGGPKRVRFRKSLGSMMTERLAVNNFLYVYVLVLWSKIASSVLFLEKGNYISVKR